MRNSMRHIRKTIHLCERGVVPLKCLACGEIAQSGPNPMSPGTPAICVNQSDWETIYKNHNEYRRCIDNPDKRDRPDLRRYPVPTEAGYYWAEWRQAEDGTYAEGHEHIITFIPEVVCVTENQDYYPDDPTSDEPEFVVGVAGVATEQLLENFVWRSAKLDPPKGKDNETS